LKALAQLGENLAQSKLSSNSIWSSFT